MRIQSTLRTTVTLGILAIGAAGLALADHGSSGRSGGSSSSTTTEIRLKTRLTGPVIGTKTPEGEAEFRSNPTRGRSRLEVEVEHVDLPAGTVMNVTLTHGGGAPTNIGTLTINSRGEGELELSSQDGDVVPAVVATDIVTVSDGTHSLVGIF